MYFLYVTYRPIKKTTTSDAVNMHAMTVSVMVMVFIYYIKECIIYMSPTGQLRRLCVHTMTVTVLLYEWHCEACTAMLVPKLVLQNASL